MAFKKNIVVGVSVNPEFGLEVAQVDFVNKTVLKYGCRQLAYDYNRKEIADLDIFKDTLQDLLTDLQIPSGSEIVLNIPAITFKITDYPASLAENEIEYAITDELSSNVIFQNIEPDISAVELPNSTIQFKKIGYTAAQKTMLIEIAMQIKALGYKLRCIDTSVNSVLNALIYNDRVNAASNANWVLLLVDNSMVRVVSMSGCSYMDCYEEKISIGEVLGDAENYATIVNTISPILKNLPSQCLYVLSKTNVINAELLATKLTYKGQIIHQNANVFASAPYLKVSPNIEDSVARLISLDVIGAAINRDFSSFSTAPFNLFNSSLGDVYLLEQPPVIRIGTLEIVLSMENMKIASIAFAIVAFIGLIIAIFVLNGMIAPKEEQLDTIKAEISSIDEFLNQNKNISQDIFDEGEQINIGLTHNKNIYSYLTIVGTEIPKKLWLTSLQLGQYTTIEGQAENLESIYSFYRNIKDYNPESAIKLQKLGFAKKAKLSDLSSDKNLDSDSLLTSINADFYEFRISDAPDVKVEEGKNEGDDGNSNNGNDNNQTNKNSSRKQPSKSVPELEIIE
jgi:Tfp pilus assembly protein PilN